MRNTISFLVGSGFSIPEKIKGVSELNSRLSKIDESEILIHTSQVAFFLRGQADPNRWSNMDERLFLQEFLEFYNQKILKPGELFHYETFYDYYSGYLANRENQNQIESFCKEFNSKYVRESFGNRDALNRLSDFNRTFNQLLASELHNPKYFEDVGIANYPPYDSFLSFLRDLLKESNIKFHTLNHDLFFDWLGRHHGDLWQHFSDGYELEGSPYYGTVSYNFNQNSNRPITKTYYVKLERFTNRFNKPLSFFKLHGSIWNTVVYPESNGGQEVRLKNNFKVSEYFEEVQDESGEYHLLRLWDQVSPDFLSGTTNKTRYYKDNDYYITLFKHFQTNLSSSDFLIVVGYGFQDPGINEMLEEHFLAQGKKMIVIDPARPNSSLFLKHQDQIQHIPKGVTQVTYDEYMELLPSSGQKS